MIVVKTRVNRQIRLEPILSKVLTLLSLVDSLVVLTLEEVEVASLVASILAMEAISILSSISDKCIIGICHLFFHMHYINCLDS